MALLKMQRQKEIDQLIDNLELQTGLSHPEDSILDIIKALNIEVTFAEFTQKGIKGLIDYSNQEETEATIYINNNLDPYVKTFTLAHELGHYLLHPHEHKLRVDRFDYSQVSKESLEETEAIYFAASLLVPKSKLQKALRYTTNLKKVADYFAVSRPVIENRIDWIKKN